MTEQHPIGELIDRANEEDAAKEFPFRSHLGGSMIGRECERELWYGFRWARKVKHSGRILRLFGRGHAEEYKFVAHLRRLGMTVKEYGERLLWHPELDSYTTASWDDHDWAQGDGGALIDVTGVERHHRAAEADGVHLKQWRISDVDGHFGGSLDGIASGWPVPPPVPNPTPEEEGLLEFKTHGTKSFVKLVVDKVRKAKPEHYAQMQIYMRKKNLRFALYCAVNKNDDDLHFEWVLLDPEFADTLIEKARRVVYSPTPPLRINNSPAHFACKWCDYAKICHYGEPMLPSCRTCVNVRPEPEGRWHCALWNAQIPSDAILAGCDNYKAIRD